MASQEDIASLQRQVDSLSSQIHNAKHTSIMESSHNKKIIPRITNFVKTQWIFFITLLVLIFLLFTKPEFLYVRDIYGKKKLKFCNLIVTIIALVALTLTVKYYMQE
jgi:TRAP-type uncharacterized transport system fused permease subunit